jgi:hypothetical protein
LLVPSCAPEARLVEVGWHKADRRLDEPVTLEWRQALTSTLSVQDAIEGLTDEDAVPELPETPTSRGGDLWVLGEHKLLVGDTTNHGDVTRLMAGDVADLVFTDPPYNVDYEGYTEQKLKIKGDRMSDGVGLRSSPAPRCTFAIHHHGNGSFRMRWNRLALRSGARSSGQRTRSRGDSADTNSGTSRFSTVTSPARRTRGMETKRNRRCGKKRSRRQTGSILRQNRLS